MPSVIKHKLTYGKSIPNLHVRLSLGVKLHSRWLAKTMRANTTGKFFCQKSFQCSVCGCVSVWCDAMLFPCLLYVKCYCIKLTRSYAVKFKSIVCHGGYSITLHKPFHPTQVSHGITVKMSQSDIFFHPLFYLEIRRNKDLSTRSRRYVYLPSQFWKLERCSSTTRKQRNRFCS